MRITLEDVLQELCRVSMTPFSSVESRQWQEGRVYGLDEAIKLIKEADAKTVIRAKWRKFRYHNEDTYECSYCGEWHDEESHYCPNCGADMGTGVQIGYYHYDMRPFYVPSEYRNCPNCKHSENPADCPECRDCIVTKDGGSNFEEVKE